MNDSTRSRRAHPQPFTLFGARGRVYARNVKQKVVDIGELPGSGKGPFSYRLDVGGLSGEGFDSAKAALTDLSQQLTFIYLDGQFTSLPGEDTAALDLDHATQIEVVFGNVADVAPPAPLEPVAARSI
jgi:hypothetical protein